MSIVTQLDAIQQQLPEHVTLVAVSKTKPNEAILEAYEAGQRIFGENKIQEMAQKYEALPKDISWHMIGHVQRNKVKYMASFVDLIHGVDNVKLLQEINKQAKKHHRIINCLLQIKIAEEDSKFGLSEEDALSILNEHTLENVAIVGLMGMGTFTNNTSQTEAEFKKLHTFYTQLQVTHPNIKILSMGMSGDFKLAIDYGSTMVRIGSTIFGTRNYS